jgi:hypothetical protein
MRINVAVPPPADITNTAQWLDQAQAACGLHHVNEDLTIANVNPWIRVTVITGESGQPISGINSEAALIAASSGNVSSIQACGGLSNPPPNA